MRLTRSNICKSGQIFPRKLSPLIHIIRNFNIYTQAHVLICVQILCHRNHDERDENNTRGKKEQIRMRRIDYTLTVTVWSRSFYSKMHPLAFV